MALPILAPAWLVAGASLLVEWLGNRAAALAFATAAIALAITAAMGILTAYVVPHVVMPPLVYQVFTVVAPSDWAAQVSAMVGIKSLSMAYKSSRYLLESVGRA